MNNIREIREDSSQFIYVNEKIYINRISFCTGDSMPHFVNPRVQLTLKILYFLFSYKRQGWLYV